MHRDRFKCVSKGFDSLSYAHQNPTSVMGPYSSIVGHHFSLFLVTRIPKPFPARHNGCFKIVSVILSLFAHPWLALSVDLPK